MKPISPVIPGFERYEVKIAENQDEYETLPALPVDDGRQIITRWRLSFRERIIALINGNIYLHNYTFRQPLQPVFLEVDEPKVSVEFFGADYSGDPNA